MMNKRPCVILVADANMAAIFRGFFSRDHWHLSIGCAPFEIETRDNVDLIVADGHNDPGIYHLGHELLRQYQSSHNRALVILDCEWTGTPGKAAIEKYVTERLVVSGWPRGAVKVIAIEPELENWVWQDNSHVSTALRYKERKPLRQLLADENLWPSKDIKPPRPKETIEWVLRRTGHPRSSSIYQELAERISLKNCKDEAIIDLLTTLRTWFPP